MDVDALLTFATEAHTTDIHIKAGRPVLLRIGGIMREVDQPPLSAEQADDIIAHARGTETADDPTAGEASDFFYEVNGEVTARCHTYQNNGSQSMVMRLLPSKPRDLHDLNLPEVLADIALSRRGLLLVSGARCSGKSTTLRAMVELLNDARPWNILTIENAIEHVYESRKSIITQLQIGREVDSVEAGVQQARRQDVDLIVIDTLNTPEANSAALEAAEAGHLVMAAITGRSACATLERMIAMNPSGTRSLAQLQLADTLNAVVCQQLAASHDNSLVPIVEILRGTATVADLIRKNKMAKVAERIESREGGMQTFDQHLQERYTADLLAQPDDVPQACPTDNGSTTMAEESKVA